MSAFGFFDQPISTLIPVKDGGTPHTAVKAG